MIHNLTIKERRYKSSLRISACESGECVVVGEARKSESGVNVEVMYSKAHQISKFSEVKSLVGSEVMHGSRGEVV